MVTLLSLWLPILISAVIVFVASFLAWMVLPHHKPDFKKLADEGGFLDMLRNEGIGIGQYVFPCIMPAEMKDPEKKARWEAGPHGVLRVYPQPNMGKNLGLVFLFYLVVGIFAGYIGTLACPVGTHYGTVFRVVGTAAIACHVLGAVPNAIFMGRTCRSVLMDVIDGAVYGVLTAGVFGWLWPTA
jgi:hypothetical protein